MKCKKCGFRARDIAGLARHYRKKHPGAMKHRTKRVKASPSASAESGMKYCPHCGERL